jgi:hypothetical protein
LGQASDDVALRHEGKEDNGQDLNNGTGAHQFPIDLTPLWEAVTSRKHHVYRMYEKVV